MNWKIAGTVKVQNAHPAAKKVEWVGNGWGIYFPPERGEIYGETYLVREVNNFPSMVLEKPYNAIEMIAYKDARMNRCISKAGRAYWSLGYAPA